MTEPITTKSQILELLRAERDRWESLIAELGEARLTEPALAGGWSIKDVIAHLAAWQQESVRRLEAAIHDEPPKPPKWPDSMSDDEINARIFEASHPRPLDDVLAEWREVFDQLIGLVRRLPEASVFNAEQFPWMDGEPIARVPLDSYEHMHDEHWNPLQQWLADRNWK